MNFVSKVQRNKFIEDNLKLVSSRVFKLNKGIFNEDLYQVGAMALTEATDRFDENKGFAFSTYAVKYIDGYIKKYKNYDSLIKPLRKKNENSSFQYKIIEYLDEPITGTEITFGDTICGDEEVEQVVVDDVFIEGFMNKLKDRERDILNLALNERTQHEISKIICISQPQVSRLLKGIGERYMRC